MKLRAIMKKLVADRINLVLLAQGALLILVLGSYLGFWGSWHVSKSTEDWSFFSSYLNNLLSPAFLFFTVLLTVSTLRQQNKDTAERIKREDIKANILQQDAMLFSQLNRSMYLTISNATAGFKRAYDFLVKDMLAIKTEAANEISFALDQAGRVKLDATSYLRAIVHNLYYLSLVLDSYSKNVKDPESYFVGYFKRRYSFDIKAFLSEGTIAARLLGSADANTKQLTEKIIAFYKSEEWD